MLQFAQCCHDNGSLEKAYATITLQRLEQHLANATAVIPYLGAAMRLEKTDVPAGFAREMKLYSAPKFFRPNNFEVVAGAIAQ